VVSGFFAEQVHHSGYDLEGGAVFSLGWYMVVVAFLAQSCFAVDGKVHLAFYDHAPLRVSVGCVRALWL